MSRDMTRPNWKRTLNRLRKLAAELRAFDFQVIEPPNVDTPPSERYAQGGPIARGQTLVLEPGEEIVFPYDGPRRSGDHGLS